MSATPPRPQDDLYRAVNHQWLKETEIPKDRSAWGNFHELDRKVRDQLVVIVDELSTSKDIEPNSVEQKIRDLYLSGMDESTLKAKGVEELGRWIEEISNIRMNDGLWRYLGKMHRYGVSGLWSCFVEPDEMESDVYSMRLFQGGLSLPDKEYYESGDEQVQKIRTAYIAHIQTMAEFSEITQIQGQNQAVYDFENKLAGFSRTSSELRDVEENYHKYSLAKLKKETPGVDWDAYFAGLGIDSPQELVVSQPEFFRQIATTVSSTDIEVIRAYLSWHVLTSFAGMMDEGFAQTNFDFFGKVLSGSEEMRPRWERVLAACEHSMGEGLGKLYVDKHFPSSSKRQLEELVEYLKQAFSSRIDNLSWMSSDTKRFAQKKLNEVIVKIGYPDRFRDYQGLSITPDSYIANRLAADAHESEYWLSRLGTAVDRSLWLMSPVTINAYFSPTTNEITFPAAILQPPFFDPNALAENFGGIGAVIGHELTHGFDDQGSMYDHRGNINEWRSQKEKQEFSARAKMMVHQASSFDVLENLKLNGELTLGENIADLGGLAMAVDALKLYCQQHDRKVTKADLQALLENYARIWRQKTRPEMERQLQASDPHAPGEFRTNNTARNLQVFYEAFDVSPEDALYLAPEARVDIW